MAQENNYKHHKTVLQTGILAGTKLRCFHHRYELSAFIKKAQQKCIFPPLFFLVPFAQLSYNEECAHSYDIMSVWKIMSSASLLLIEANNLSLEKLYAK